VPLDHLDGHASRPKIRRACETLRNTSPRAASCPPCLELLDDRCRVRLLMAPMSNPHQHHSRGRGLFPSSESSQAREPGPTSPTRTRPDLLTIQHIARLPRALGEPQCGPIRPVSLDAVGRDRGMNGHLHRWSRPQLLFIVAQTVRPRERSSPSGEPPPRCLHRGLGHADCRLFPRPT